MLIALSLEHFFSKDTPSVSPQGGEPPTPQVVGKGWTSKEMFEIIFYCFNTALLMSLTSLTMASETFMREMTLSRE